MNHEANPIPVYRLDHSLNHMRDKAIIIEARLMPDIEPDRKSSVQSKTAGIFIRLVSQDSCGV
jgi:hypothetical protein